MADPFLLLTLATLFLNLFILGTAALNILLNILSTS